MHGRVVAAAAVLLALAAGCSDVNPAGPIQDPAVVSWMEWRSEIAFPGTGAPVRMIGFRSGCGRFRIGITVTEYNLVELRPYEEREENEPCPLYEDGLPPFDIIGIFDTLVPLPSLPATTPRTPFLLSAPTWDYFGTTITRIFGDFWLVSQVADTTLRVAGRVELVADSLGCSWAYAQMSYMPGRTMVLDTLMDLGGERRSGFLRGRLLPASPARCGQSVALHVEGALLEY